MCQGEWKCVHVRTMVVFQGELPFAINVKGGENVVRRGFMTVGGVLVLPSMPKGEIVGQRLSLMSIQAAPGANPILQGNFDLPNYYILVQECFFWFLLVEMFLLIYGTPCNSSQFERYSCSKFVPPVTGLEPHRVGAWVIENS